MKGLFVLMCFLHVYSAQGCNYSFKVQPPSEFTICNPVGRKIFLDCFTEPDSIGYNWYYTSDLGETVSLLTRDDDDDYEFDTSFGLRLKFTVTNDTIGWYWCEPITSNHGPLKNSTISNIHMNYNAESSLPACYGNLITNSQDRDDSCADIDIHVVLTSSSVQPSPFVSDQTIITTTSTTPPGTIYSMSTLLILSTQTHMVTTTNINALPSSTSTIDNNNNTSKGVPDPPLVYALGGVCVVLALIALLICVAILVLCLLTRRQKKSSHTINEGQAISPDQQPHEMAKITKLELDDCVSPAITALSPPTCHHNHHNGVVNSSSNVLLSSPPLPPPPVLVAAASSQIPHTMSFSNPVYEMGLASSLSDKQQNPLVVENKWDSGQRPKYAKPDLSKKRSRSESSPQEKDPNYEIFPHLAQSPPSPPPPIPPQDLNGLYDPPEDTLSPTDIISPVIHTPASYMVPRLITPSGDIVLYDMPLPEEIPDYDDPDAQGYELMNKNNGLIPQECNYDNPWGSMPTGIKRSSTKSRGSSAKSGNPPGHSLSPCNNNLFDDPLYDSPSPKDISVTPAPFEDPDYSMVN